MLPTVPKWRPLRWNLSFGKRKKSHGLRSGECGGCGTTEIPFWPKILSRRWQCDREYCRDAASKCPQSLAGHESFKDLTTVLFINCLSWRHEFLMNNALIVEKQISMVLIFGRSELVVCHSELCCLVSGSYSKIHDSSPVMTWLKKCLLF